MRGPRIILRDTSDKESRRKSFLHRHEIDPVVAMTWTVAGTDAGTRPLTLLHIHVLNDVVEDIFPRVRLLATRESGATTIYSLSRSDSGSWSVSEHRETTDGVSHTIPNASFVLDLKLGAARKADRSGLAEVIHSSAEEAVKGTSFWVTAGAKGVKCVLDITGERIGRAEWPSKIGKVENVTITRKASECLKFKQSSGAIDADQICSVYTTDCIYR